MLKSQKLKIFGSTILIGNETISLPMEKKNRKIIDDFNV